MPKEAFESVRCQFGAKASIINLSAIVEGAFEKGHLVRHSFENSLLGKNLFQLNSHLENYETFRYFRFDRVRVAERCGH